MKTKPLKALLLLATALTLSSCATTISPVSLPLPPELILPKVPAAQLSCLSDETYTQLVRRDKLLQARIKTLIGIINSTRASK